MYALRLPTFSFRLKRRTRMTTLVDWIMVNVGWMAILQYLN